MDMLPKYAKNIPCSDNMLLKLEIKHQEEINDLEDDMIDLENTLNALKKKYRENINDLKNKHQEEINDLKNKLKTIRSFNELLPEKNHQEVVYLNNNKCVVCMDRTKDVVITTCKHLYVCSVCVYAMDKCPICRTEYDSDKDVMKIYI